MKQRLFVTGTLGHDIIMHFPGRFIDRINPDKLGSISLSFLVDKMTRHFGGTAGNISYTLKLLGLGPTILAPAGNDFDEYRAFLTKRDITTSGIVIHSDEPTSTYTVITDAEANQIGSFYIGASKYAGEILIPTDMPRDTFCVISPTIPEAMVAYVRMCTAVGIPYLYDPAFQTGAFSREELLEGIAHADIVVGNDYEIALMGERLSMTHEELRSHVKILVTTLGAKGSRIEEGLSSAWEISACPVEHATDPTGAGDAFRGGFLAGYLRGMPLDVCGKMGSVAAAYVVEQTGTLSHDYTVEDYLRRFEDAYHTRIRLDGEEKK